ncbi:MAG: inositol monophosphatase family protein, partial [Longimicrobiales bacterium]
VEADGGERRPLPGRGTPGRPLRAIVSRSHTSERVIRMLDGIGVRDYLPCGSVGIKCARIAEGEADLYVHPVAYMSEWDTCAPELIVRECGGFVGDCYGRPLRYNKRDPTQPDGMIAASGAVPESLIQRVTELYTEEIVHADS